MKLPTYKGYKYKITGKRGNYQAYVYLTEPYTFGQIVTVKCRTKAHAIHFAKCAINRWIEL
jgi:hypothetical protein